MREFILGAMLIPTTICFVWFAGTGSSALLLELDGTAAGRIFAADHASRIYTAVEVMLPGGLATLIKAVLTGLFLLLIVASTTAAIIAIKSIGAAGSHRAETRFHSMLWTLVIAAIAGAVMALDGTRSVRDVMIAGALPFSAILALVLISVVRMAWSEHRAAQNR